MIKLPFRWNDAEGSVRAGIGINDNPAVLGCSEIARGFPYCRATVEHPGEGYADVLGWVQLMNSSLHGEGFQLDHFEPLGRPQHPFAFYGWSPTLFDAPHSDEGDWEFLAQSFLCGLGGELLEYRHEVRAVLGFSWGFSIRDGSIESFGPAPLSSQDWDLHRDYLTERYAKWSWKFPSGFHQHSLES